MRWWSLAPLVRIRAKSLKFWKCYRELKNKIFSFIWLWDQKYAPWWEDFKYGLKIEIRQHLNPFLAEKPPKSGEFGYFASFWAFSRFFGQKRGQMPSDFNSETRFWILSSGRIFLAPKLKKIDLFFTFCPNIAFPKLQRFCADPYTSQIKLKFRIQCFGTVRQLLGH